MIPVLSFANFTIGLGAFVVIGVMNPIAEGLGVGPADAGTVLTTYAIAYAIGSPIGIALTGRMSRRRVLTIALALFGTGALLSALAPTLAMLNAARVVAAAGAGLVTPVAASIALAVSAPEERGRSLARVFFGLTFAQVLGVPAGSWIGYTFGWQSAFGIVTLLSIASLLAVRRLVPPDLAFQVNDFRTLGAALADWRSLVAVLFTASYLAAIYVVYTYLAPLLAERQGFGRDGVTAVLLMFGIGAVAGNLLGGRLADAFGSRRTLMFACLSQAVCLPLFSLLPFGNVWLFALTLVWSTCGWSFMVAQQTRLVAQTPERQNVVLALNAAAIYIGAAIGSAIGAAVAGSAGLAALGVSGGALVLLALAHLVLGERLAGVSTQSESMGAVPGEGASVARASGRSA